VVCALEIENAFVFNIIKSIANETNNQSLKEFLSSFPDFSKGFCKADDENFRRFGIAHDDF